MARGMLSALLALDTLAEAHSAGVGGVVCTAILYPIEIIKNRLQSASGEHTFLSIGRDIWRRDGLGGFYNGCKPSSIWGYSEKFVYFYFFSLMRVYHEARWGELGVRGNIMINYLCEWCPLPLTMPLETITVQCQIADKPLGMLEAARITLAEKGIGGFYRNAAVYVMFCFKPAIQYSIFQTIKTWLLRRRGDNVGRFSVLTGAEAFLVGMVARAVATLIIFPYQRAKMLNLARAPPKRAAGEGAGDSWITAQLRALYVALALPGAIILRVLREEGFVSLYRGLGPDIGRGVFSSAIMLATKEKIFLANYRLLTRLASANGKNQVRALT